MKDRTNKGTKPAKTKDAALQNAFSKENGYWTMLLWSVFFINALFLIPWCLDRYMAPRFLWLSLSLLIGIWALSKDLKNRADWRFHLFDGLMLGWYGLNLASVSWSFSKPDAFFYAQKVFLMVLVYWIMRQSFQRDARQTRQTLRQATTLLTFAAMAIMLVQIGLGFPENGLNNEKLYDAATGVYGNKSLATEFLFFLLLFNLFFYRDYKKPSAFWTAVIPLLALIVLLQTRTVYIALFACAVFYFPGRALLDPVFAKVFKTRILPAGILMIALLAAFLVVKGKGSSLAERLNPMTYAESVSANERRFVWYKTDELNKDHFWLGVGDGSWKIWLPSKNIEGGFRQQEENIVFTRAHNDYLEVRAEMGITGGVLFVALFLACFTAGFIALQQSKDPDHRQDLMAAMTGLIGYCIVQYFDFPRERIEMQVVLGCFLAWTVYLSRDVWQRLPGLNINNYTRWAGILVAAGLIFNVFIGWYRVWGEIHNLNMLNMAAKKDYKMVVSEAKAAQNPFYVYDDVVLPLKYHEGIGYFYLNQVDDAIDAFSIAYEMNPWSFPVINNYASALAKAKRYQEAIPLLEKSVEINPKFEEGKLNLAFSWLQQGDYAKSTMWLNRVDTIPNPHTDQDRLKNKATLAAKTELLKILAGKLN
jgi:O-antigen ligase